MPRCPAPARAPLSSASAPPTAQRPRAHALPYKRCPRLPCSNAPLLPLLALLQPAAAVACATAACCCAAALLPPELLPCLTAAQPLHCPAALPTLPCAAACAATAACAAATACAVAAACAAATACAAAAACVAIATCAAAAACTAACGDSLYNAPLVDRCSLVRSTECSVDLPVKLPLLVKGPPVAQTSQLQLSSSLVDSNTTAVPCSSTKPVEQLSHCERSAATPVHPTKSSGLPKRGRGQHSIPVNTAAACAAAAAACAAAAAALLLVLICRCCCRPRCSSAATAAAGATAGAITTTAAAVTTVLTFYAEGHPI
ncbi:unnamed protein product [Closterium sp. NIES-54]